MHQRTVQSDRDRTALSRATTGNVDRATGRASAAGMTQRVGINYRASASARNALVALDRDAALVVASGNPLEAVQLHARLFSPAYVRAALLHILQSSPTMQQIAARSYVHDNGFIKLVLVENAYKLRLHYRPAERTQPGAENIHDHRWNFLSNVLFGDLAVDKFLPCDAGTPGAFPVQDCEYRARKQGASSYGVVPLGTAHVRHVSMDIYAANSTYYLDGSVLHSIVTRAGSAYATLVLTHPPFSATTRLMPTSAYPRNSEVYPMSLDQVAAVSNHRLLHSPKGKSMQRVVVSSQGHARLKRLLSDKSMQYDTLRAERQRAFELSGDGWHDNPYFNILQQQEAELTRQLAELKGQVSRAQVLDVQDGKRPMDVVRYGSIVLVQVGDAPTPVLWEIEGFDESDSSAGKLAYSSPLGCALIGQEPGDSVQIDGRHVEILALYASWSDAKAQCVDACV